MQIDEIRRTWKIDSKIDLEDIESQSLMVDSLHYKYSNILYDLALEKSEVTGALNYLNCKKLDFYSGIGERPSSKTVLKSLAPNYVKGDADIIATEHKLEEVTARYKYVESILWVLARRNTEIQNHINVLKLQRGV